MKKIALLLGISGLLGLGFTSCDKEYDSPPLPTIEFGTQVTLDTLINWFGQNGPMSITEDYHLFGVLTSDASSGNFYKEAYFQETQTGQALYIRFTAASSLRIGDSVRIYLKGTYLTNTDTFSGGGILELDSVDVDKNIFIQDNDKDIEPTNLSVLQATTGKGKLVQIDNVEFQASDLGKTWADAVTQSDVSLYLTDCNGNLLEVRTSGYSNFAGDVVPEGSGSVIGIVGEYNGTPQFLIRDPNELTLTGTRCTSGGTVVCDPVNSVSENYSGYGAGATISEFCWESIATSGAPQWAGGNISGDNLAVAALSGTSINGAQSMWMVTPEITYASSNTLSFSSAVQNWNHDGLEVFVLTNYSGDPNTATQTAVTGASIANSGTADNTLTSSGTIALSAFGISGTYRIGFKYSGNPLAGETSSYKIDNVVISQ